MADNINISPDMIDNLVNMLKNSSQADNNSTQNSENTSKSSTNNFSNNLDFDSIMKMKSIIDNLNTSNDQDSRLLYSLKPYLRKSRQAKLDQYINILKITQVSKLFNKKGDDN